MKHSVPAVLAATSLAAALTGAGCATPRISLEPRVFTSDASGFDTHSYWVDTGKEVVVFDAQFTPALAEQLIADIRSQTSSPIRWVVVTHPNPDKFNGTSAFRAAGARVVASEATAAAIPTVHAYKRAFFVDFAKMFTAESYPPQATVDVTFRGSLQLPLEAGEVELRELVYPGVSSTQTVAWLPSTRNLLVGDLVHVKAHAWLEGGIVDGAPRPDVDGWLASLDELRAFEGATVRGGRGGSAPVAEAVEAEQAYLRRARALVKEYVDGLAARKAELLDERAAQHHRAIAERLAAEFPDYALPYLVEYGVYGLANQLASASH